MSGVLYEPTYASALHASARRAPSLAAAASLRALVVADLSSRWFRARSALVVLEDHVIASLPRLAGAAAFHEKGEETKKRFHCAPLRQAAE